MNIRLFSITVNAPISARRLVHVLVKLGKIMKSTQHQRRPASPSMLSEDREVTDIMNRHNVSFPHYSILIKIYFFLLDKNY